MNIQILATSGSNSDLSFSTSIDRKPTHDATSFKPYPKGTEFFGFPSRCTFYRNFFCPVKKQSSKKAWLIPSPSALIRH